MNDINTPAARRPLPARRTAATPPQLHIGGAQLPIQACAVHGSQWDITLASTYNGKHADDLEVELTIGGSAGESLTHLLPAELRAADEEQMFGTGMFARTTTTVDLSYVRASVSGDRVRISGLPAQVLGLLETMSVSEVVAVRVR